MRRRAPTVLALAISLALGFGLAACGSEFPATSACPEEPRAAGRLPDLEPLLPAALAGQAPNALDSGWNCLPTTLGSYAAHGVTRLEFAGATWDAGNGDGAVAAVFRATATDPLLQAAWVEEFYERGARASRGVENVETSRVGMTVAGGALDVWRLDALNNLSLQTIIAWPHGEHVHVVLIASTVEPGASRDAHEARVDETVLAAASVVADAAIPPSSSPRASAIGSVLLSPA